MTHTTKRLQPIFEMFVDSTAGESYHENRIITEETDSGTVALTAYGWVQLAEYDESENHVTVYFGHKSIGSSTISRWLNRVLEVASERREVTISDESPTVRTPNEGVEFIGNYIKHKNKSSVEAQAEETVIESLSYLSNVV